LVWTGDTAQMAKPTRLTEGVGMTVSGFSWSPDGSKIAFEHRTDPLITSGNSSDISILTVSNRAVTPLVVRPGADGGPVWSPDGQWIAFSTSAGDTASNFYRNNQVMKVAAAGGTPIRLATDFDEQIGNLAWAPSGIWFVAFEKTNRGAYRIDPESGAVGQAALGAAQVGTIDISVDGRHLALIAQENATT
jgi:Tol biopolymer transport system component